ncbi:MAG: hypothetical protein ACYC5N_05670 [Endomicrobiales bacterium]
MKKIKKFKINIRLKEVLRLLKNTTQVPQITPEMEEAVQKESRRLSALITPAALYETHPREKLPSGLGENPPENWVAASLILVTIGADVEREIREAQQKGDKVRGHILHSLALEALEQSGNFVNRLITDEAKEESCELSRRQAPASRPVWDTFFSLVPGDKIGVQLLESGEFNPIYSTGALAYWSPAKKRGSRQG